MNGLLTLAKTFAFLLQNGQATAADYPTADLSMLDLWHVSDTGEDWIASHRLIALWQSLPDERETLAAIFACVPDIRTAWCRIIAARLLEAGQRGDTGLLAQQITDLGPAARDVEQQLANAELTATPYFELERQLFWDASADMGQASPKLLRALRAGAELRQAKPATLRTLPALDPDHNPRVDWCRGRLLFLPKPPPNLPLFLQRPPPNLPLLKGEELPPPNLPLLKGEELFPPLTKGRAREGFPLFILSGDLSPLATVPEREPTMSWVLARPWAFLLAQLTFVQDNWQAERITGALGLELDPSQQDQFCRPPHVQIVVTTRNGDEVLCGNLAELILRVLQRLDIALLAHQLTAQALDLQLGQVIEALLDHQVWDFHYASGGLNPSYTINRAFADSCGRRLGSKTMYRLGSHVSNAIRQEAEAWAEERLQAVLPVQRKTA